MARTRLRAVQADDAPEEPLRKPTMVEAAASGDHKALLVAMRDRIAVAVQNPECPPRDLASLTRRLAEVAREIKAMELAEQQEADESVPDDVEFDPASV